MRTKTFRISLTLSLLLTLATVSQGTHAQSAQDGQSLQKAPHEQVGHPATSSIYDASADGAKQISEALTIAKKQHKRILLDFGANWCIWCHRLHTLFTTNKAVANELDHGYIIVMIDVNRDRNDATNNKYKNPTRLGLPAIVILDAEGNQLTTKDSGDLEEGDHHSPEKVLAFLKQWEQKR